MDQGELVSEGSLTCAGRCDYAKARDRHFAHVPNSSLKSTSVESVKYPIENRIWFTYPGQANPPGSIYAGTVQQPSEQPSAVGCVLGDGTTQLSRFSYDTAAFKPTRAIDPVGRTTRFAYGANQIHLLAITRTTANGTLTPIAPFTFDDRHRPLVREARDQVRGVVHSADPDARRVGASPPSGDAQV